MFTLTILTPDGKKHVSELTRISLPTEDGIRTILTNHMEAVIPVEIGRIKLIAGKESDNVAISEGIFYFKENVAKLFVRTYELSGEIELARAERAKERAEERLATELDAREHVEAELALKRAISRLSTRR